MGREPIVLLILKIPFSLTIALSKVLGRHLKSFLVLLFHIVVYPFLRLTCRSGLLVAFSNTVLKLATLILYLLTLSQLIH